MANVAFGMIQGIRSLHEQDVRYFDQRDDGIPFIQGDSVLFVSYSGSYMQLTG